MDSVTQFALGAGISLAVLGRHLGPRRAAVTGGLLGTVPDLDVLYPFEDPIDSFVLHRGATHSLILQAAVTPLFGEALLRVFKELRDKRLTVYLAVYLCFATHALLDALTIYGTKLFWPLWKGPLGAGSIFIIDPLYTLPLLVITVWALCLKSWSARFGRGPGIALAISTLYLGWGLASQQIALERALRTLADHGVVPERLIATPTPFNTLFWKAIAIDGERYINLYIPILGGDADVTAYTHPRGEPLTGCLDDRRSLDKLTAFSKGFYRVERVGDEVVVSDLRMGLTPDYAFRFAIARDGTGGLQAVPPRRREAGRGGPEDLDWLISSLSGNYGLRAAEALSVLSPVTDWMVTSRQTETRIC